MSLPNGRSTLAQMATTDHEQSLSSNLKVTIPDNLKRTQVTCENNNRAAVTKSFILATGKTAANLFSCSQPHTPVGEGLVTSV